MNQVRPIRARIKSLKAEFDRLRIGKESLLTLLDEAELPEMVYNSNAIENSTLTLPETEKILMEMEVARNINLREVYEAQNLARVAEYLRRNATVEDINEARILFLHKMLLGNIDDSIAGRLRQAHEYVRVGTHIAPAPEHVGRLMENMFLVFSSDHESHFVDKIATFHLEFEIIHPFNDGNGRIGRIVINWQLNRLGFPNVILRDKGKEAYYQTFGEYRTKNNIKTMSKILSLALTESLHKRLSYLRGEQIITVVEYAQQIGKSASIVLNAALRQTIPAFRERGVWKIGVQPRVE